MPDAHALQVFGPVARGLCRRGLALEYFDAGHTLLDLELQLPGGSVRTFRPNTGWHSAAAAALPKPAAADDDVQLRFPDFGGFFSTIAGYMARNVPGELWMKRGQGPVFDPEADFAVHQALRAVIEGIGLELQQRWDALAAALQDSQTSDEEVVRLWHLWLWLVEERCQLHFLQTHDTTWAGQEAPQKLASEVSWQRLEKLTAVNAKPRDGAEGSSSTSQPAHVPVLTRAAVAAISSEAAAAEELDRLHYVAKLAVSWK